MFQQTLQLPSQSAPSHQQSAHFLPYVRQPRLTSQCIFTLGLATAVLAAMLDNSQYAMWLTPKSQNLH
jgi:hypothetical protein